jgi:hypothetical protein
MCLSSMAAQARSVTAVPDCHFCVAARLLGKVNTEDPLLAVEVYNRCVASKLVANSSCT